MLIKGHKSKKDRQHNCQKKRDKKTNNDQQSIAQRGKDRATQTPLKTEGELNFHHLLKTSGVEALCKFCTETKYIQMYMKNVRQTQCYHIENSVSSKIQMFDNFLKNIILI